MTGTTATQVQTTYRAVGKVRGWCGHNHKTLKAAQDCVWHDQAGCKSVGGYSDRVVRRADGEDLSEAERGALEDLYEADQLRSAGLA